MRPLSSPHEHLGSHHGTRRGSNRPRHATRHEPRIDEGIGGVAVLRGHPQHDLCVGGGKLQRELPVLLEPRRMDDAFGFDPAAHLASGLEVGAGHAPGLRQMAGAERMHLGHQHDVLVGDPPGAAGDHDLVTDGECAVGHRDARRLDVDASARVLEDEMRCDPEAVGDRAAQPDRAGASSGCRSKLGHVGRGGQRCRRYAERAARARDHEDEQERA
jgi:hypothetical protein